MPERSTTLLLAVGLAGATVLATTSSWASGETAGETLLERIAGREIAYRHPPLDDPEVRPAAAADHMRPDDVVAGVTLGGSARAYPWWVLKNHHAVNDTLAGEPVVIAFCEQCSAATAFQRTLDDRVLELETEGVVNGTIILRDRATDTLWAPFDGEALEGPLAGARLERIPVFLTTWDDWKRRHPATDVVYAGSELRDGHGSRESPGYWGVVGEMGETLRSWDTRLTENEFVFGVSLNGDDRAYPFRTIEAAGGVVNDQLGELPLVVAARGAFEMAAYDRRLGERRLSFAPAGGGEHALRDVETGSLWTIEGAAVEGPLSGRRLAPVDGYSVEWHVWSEYHPGSEVFGEAPGSAPVRFRFPLTSLPRLFGESVRVVPLDLDGPLNVVVVWARWCPPCRDKVPQLAKLAAEAPARGYRFRSIAVQLPNSTELNGLKGFLFEHGIDWPVFLFDEAGYAEFDAYYREHGGRGLVIPTVFLIDGDGEVVRVLEGAAFDRIDRAIDELAPPSPPSG